MATISRPSIGPPKRKYPLVLSVSQKLLHYWHQASNHLETRNAASDEKVKIVCISDTHNTQPDIPDGDILLHAGDLSQYGMFDEIQKQLDWLHRQPHKWKIVIAGNHDLLLDSEFVKAHPDRELEQPGKQRSDLRWGDLIYLDNSVAELKIPSASSTSSRKLRIFGSPLTPRFGNFAFQYDTEKPENHDIWGKLDVGADIDIFITHGPPFGHLDDCGKGCPLLLKTLWKLQPRLMVFGHIHPGRGQHLLRFDDVEICYSNILLNHRTWLYLIIMLLRILWFKIITAALTQNSCHRSIKYCQLVNAAIVGNSHHGPGIKEPIVVYL